LLIVCLLTGLICAIRFGKGKSHDFEMFKSANFDLSNELEVSVDSGFQGIQHLHSKVELTKQQKKQNTKKASKRVPVEHTNRKCKIFKICGCRFRGKHSNYESTWLLIVAIVNLKESTRHLLFSTI
jgi:DDE superfamily endonuclease